jgi:type IV secretion system protein VirB10
MTLRLGLRAAIAVCSLMGFAFSAASQTPDAAQPAATPNAPQATPSYTVVPGTHIALGLINSVSTKHSSPGDRIYLETVFPIVINSHIVIPPGSYVTGTVTEVKRPGRVRGKGELYVRFDSITLPNGVTRDFRSRLGGIDARGNEHLDKKEGTIMGDSNKGGDARTIGEGAASGASIGAIAGAAASHAGMGAAIGGGAGAAAGLIGVLLTRGPEAVLAKGSTIEMVLDRPLVFEANEVSFNTMGAGARFSDGPGPAQNAKNSSMTSPVRRIPF